MEVKKEGRGYALYIRLPFAEKERIQVWTRGDELVVQVDNQQPPPHAAALAGPGGASWPRPSPTQRLRVAFGEKEAHAAS